MEVVAFPVLFLLVVVAAVVAVVVAVPHVVLAELLTGFPTTRL